MLKVSTLFLAGMPWNILMPIFLFGVGFGIFMANRSSNQKLK